MNTVLIVEDEILEQEFLKSIVEKELLPDDTVLTCESGLKAVELAKQYKPNIIIMDLMISEVDGLTAIEGIRNFLPNASIMILSAYSDFSYAQKAINLKVSEYLLKPVKPDTFKEVFRKVIQAAPQQNAIVESSTTSENKKKFIEESLDYIDEHFKEKLTLEMVASHVFMSPKYFSQVFKKEMEVTFTEYIIQVRVKYACKLLETTNYPIYRISSECGFSDPSYFNRVFCAQKDMTPNAYRSHVRTS
ncbi:AraC family transcriptional regulator [Proteinivorax hydrogeniformans]|uniref:Stage 0 sporulation protein A homolog n=1 Tax=Proteinivorax hydrogeniformans TaxID=1826727 RepID=A0AAU8HU91_9FIRM